MAELGISLRDFMDVRFGAIRRELADLRDAVEKLADQGERVARLEGDMRVVRWVGGALVTVVVALVAAWLKALLGV